MEDLTKNPNQAKQKGLSLVISFFAILILTVAIACFYGYLKYSSNPCNHTTYYDIGTVDPQFKISQDDFKNTINKSVAVWERADNKNLFEYKTGATFKINLIYDTRQSESTQRQDTLSQIDSSKKGYDALKSQYDTLNAQYQISLKKYESEVSYYNSHGGAPQSEYDRLKQEQNSLNSTAKQINDLASSLNQLSKDLNLNISEINTTAGKTFEKGLFKPNEIDIYEYSSNQELFITLVHEFGHALNMNHVEDTSSIMYYMVNETNSKDTTPTNADLQELNRVCKVNYFSL